MLRESLKLSSPWVILYRKIEAMFEDDRMVNVVFDEEDMDIKLYVKESFKAAALDRILEPEHHFGNTAVTVTVVPPNSNEVNLDDHLDRLFHHAFYNTPAYVYTKTIDHPALPKMTYVVFAREVVQYFTDDMGDLYGMASTLYEELARELFIPQTGIFYCTAVSGHDPVGRSYRYYEE